MNSYLHQPYSNVTFPVSHVQFLIFHLNSITDECGSERPTPDIRFLLQDCVMSLILNISVNSLSNLQIRDSFEILMTSRFQNCPFKIDKELTEIFKVKGVGLRGPHPTVSGILTLISNRVGTFSPKKVRNSCWCNFLLEPPA